MFYNGLKVQDVANGDGIRVSLFVSGCKNHCLGCFNKSTWDFTYGKPFNKEVLDDILEALSFDFIKGFSLLGGEPFEVENQKTCAEILKNIKESYPEKDIWCWSGYLLSDLQQGGKRFTKYSKAMLEYIDVLVDGPFVQEKYNQNLRFRGSENQQIYKKQNGIFIKTQI